MARKLSRRDFLKLSSIALSGLAFRDIDPERADQNVSLLGRVTIPSISIYKEPLMDSVIVGQRFRDELVPIYYEITPPTGPVYNPRWYRVWGGYAHSAYLQKVQFNIHDPLQRLPERGRLCEVSVPYSQSLIYSKFDGWQSNYRLYYESTHWVTSIEEGPDRKPWYRITHELGNGFYFAPATHFRPIPTSELTPISSYVPPEDKRIQVDLKSQTLTAYEGDQMVLRTTISTGLPSSRPGPNGIPTATPRGRFHVSVKLPSKHMGWAALTDSLDDYVLPGVPWTGFFHTTGVAFHGTYWHNNFGLQMSHGCVNMRNADAKWLFRWTTPVNAPDSKEKRGYGTLIEVI